MFFTDDPEYTKHGYYIVNGIKTYSKFEAWQLSQDMSQIKFIFNDDVFTQKYQKEPEEDIYELYRRRAVQLREDYDYLVLIYSGGIDSHTILETFLENNIKLDEICTFSNNDVQAKTEKFNQEVYNAAIPFVETLDLKKIGTQFRLLNIGKLIVDQLDDEYHYENFQHYSFNTPFWRTAVSNHVLKAKIPEHRKLVEQGKRVCYIWGHDKPTIHLNDKQEYCLTVVDAFAGGFSGKQYNNRVILKNYFDNFYDEAFYICREFPEISIKQGYMLVDLLTSMTSTDSRLKHIREIPIFGPYVQYSSDQWLTKSAVDRCIYPKALMSRFGDDKLYKGSMLFSKKDNWFYESNHKNSAKLLDKMNHIIRNNKEFFRFKKINPADPNTKDFVFSTKPLYSQFYPIIKK